MFEVKETKDEELMTGTFVIQSLKTDTNAK